MALRQTRLSRQRYRRRAHCAALRASGSGRSAVSARRRGGGTFASLRTRGHWSGIQGLPPVRQGVSGVHETRRLAPTRDCPSPARASIGTAAGRAVSGVSVDVTTTSHPPHPTSHLLPPTSYLRPTTSHLLPPTYYLPPPTYRHGNANTYIRGFR